MKLILLTLLVGSAFCDYGSQKSGYEQAPDVGNDVSADGGDQQAYNNEPANDSPKAGGTDGVINEPFHIKLGPVHKSDKSNDAPQYPSGNEPKHQGSGYIKTGGADQVDGTDTDPIKIKVSGVQTPKVPGKLGTKVEQSIVPTFEKPKPYSDAGSNPSGYETANDAGPPASATGGDQLGYSNEVRLKFRRF